MSWPPWPKGNEKDLARYALSDVADRVWLAVGRDDLLAERKHRELLRAMYEALLARDIRYAREKFDPILEQQIIRHPKEILEGAGDATCLDLSLLFAGLCLGKELLPLVVVLDGHVFVVVSLVRDLRDAGGFGRQNQDQDGSWAAEGLLKDGKTLHELVKRGDYLPIECTGFARSESINPRLPEGIGRKNGQLTFDRAVEAGREQLSLAERAFSFAIDIAVLQNVHRILPYKTDGYVRRPKVRSRDRINTSKNLPILCDRNPQEKKLEEFFRDFKVRSTRPLLLILPGRVEERHDFYFHRIKWWSLEEHLAGGKKEVHMITKNPCEFTSPNDLRREVLGVLRKEKNGKDEDIVAYITHAKLKAVVIRIPMSASQCSGNPQKHLQLIADYLASFPDTRESTLVSLVVSFEEDEEPGIWKRWWNRDLLNKSIQELQRHYPDDSRVLVRTLPRLTSLIAFDVRLWLEHKLVNLRVSYKEIEGMFQGRDSLPMDDLYPKLVDLLERNQHLKDSVVEP